MRPNGSLAPAGPAPENNQRSHGSPLKRGDSSPEDEEEELVVRCGRLPAGERDALSVLMMFMRAVRTG